MIDEAGFIGINELGNILGLDPRISYTLGVTLGTSLGTGYIRDPITGDWKFDVDRMWRGAINGLTNPRTLSIAFSVAGDAIGLDPIYNNIIINLAMGAIEGGLENPQDIISGMFKGIFDNFIQTSIRALTLDLYDPLTGGWNKNWQAEYTTIHLINFIEIVQRDGIVPALEHYMSTIFRDDAIRSINEVGGIADFLTGHAEIVYEDGVAKKKINFTDDYKLYLDPNTDEVIGRDYGTTKERGAYGVNPFTNGFGLIDGTLEETTENGSVIYHVRDSVIIDRIDFSGARGHYSILANSLETGFELNENGIPLGGVVMDFEGNRIFQYEWVGDAVRAELNFDNPSNTNIKNVVNVDFSGLTNEQKQEVINYYLIMNGIKNREFYGSPRYMFNFEDRLQTISPGYDDITLVPLYNDKMPKIDADSLEEIVGYQKDLLFDNLKESGYINEDGTLKKTFYDLAGAQDMMLYPEFEEKRQIIYDFLVQLNTTFFNNANDLLRDIADWCLKTDAIANQIYQKLVETYGTNWPSDMTGLGYSGSGDPFLYMLNNNPQIDVNAIVLVGTPIKGDRWVENTNVDTVVTLYGEKDYVFLNSNQFLRQDFYASKGRLFENNPRQINEVVIKLKDIGHTDYFYDPSNPGTNAVLKQKATEFIARVTALAKDSDALSRFLNDTYGIDRDSTGKYVVDLERIIYNG